MASASTSSLQKSFKYDVFLSFRGKDTRKNFVDHLYYALTQKGIETYKDDEKIKQGKMISDELIEAIEDSKFYIIIFSKNYASSSWCLEELVKIMECRKGFGHTAYPVFYDVEPTEVRKQSGLVGDAFAKHKEDQAAGRWREALKEASDLAGFELKSIANGHEAEFIHKIVEEISLELRFINQGSDGNLIGMETRVDEVISSLELGVGDVRMLGIWGMGGAGKTTLARAIFDQISNQFDGESFIENVREVSKASLKGLKKLQKQVLSDVLNDKNIEVSSVSGGKIMMQRRLHGRKVLVILDDIDHKDQLEALAGDRNWFKPGSRIVITTRDEQVLVAHRVSLIHNVTLLSQAEARCLFSRYAFGREIPVQGYEELSMQVIHYAAGLPLTIKVLGSFLCGQNEPYWEAAIERLKKFPLKETLGRLEISFDSLDDDHKEIFLDVACILKGWRKDDAIRVIESRGFHAEVGFRVLEQRSLITYNKYGILRMHDHLEEMGKNIVRRSHPEEPQRHSRLWIDEEIEHILRNDLGTPETKCLFFHPWGGFSPEIAIKGLAKMKDLRFIHIWVSDDDECDDDECDDDECIYFHSWKFDKVSEYLPSSLRYISWVGYHFSSLPNTFQGKHLVGLEIHQSNFVQLWEDGEEKVLNNLRFLKISWSEVRTFDFRLAPKLEYLDITGSRLTNLHLGKTPNLKTLKFKDCDDLVELQMPAESLKLKHLHLSLSKLKTIHFGRPPNLEKLILDDCNDLVELEMPSTCLKFEELNFSHSKLRTLDLGFIPNLKRLNLENCYDLVEIKAPVGCLSNLDFLDLSGCGRFKYFVFDSDNDVCSLSELHLIAHPTDVCPLHSDNDSPKFQFSCRYKEDPASSCGNLERLISIGLCACTNLDSFSRSICSLQFLRKLTLQGCIPEVPRDLDQLECLEELIISLTDTKNLPDSICVLKHLKSLEIKSCYLLEMLPDDIGRLESLERLTLMGCILLRVIPNSICEMKRLEYLRLPYCILLEKLPEKLGHLECLKELDIEGTDICLLPQSIFMLKGRLRIIGDRWLLESCGLTIKRRRISDEDSDNDGDEMVCDL